MEEDLTDAQLRDLTDLTRLCIAFNVKPTVAPTKDKSDGLGLLLEQKVKEVAFLYTYLNEKIQKRNIKCKSVLHPQLQKKQILCDCLKGLWETQLRVQKQKLQQQTEKMNKETEKLAALNDVDRAKLND